MPDGPALPSAPPGVRSAGDLARAIGDSIVWNAPAAVSEARLWRRTTTAVASRAGGEGYWKADHHVVMLGLTFAEQITVGIEGGRPKQLGPLPPGCLRFIPAGVGVRTTMSMSAPKIAWIGVVQRPEIYRDLASEGSWPASFADFDPTLIFDDPRATLLIEGIAKEISGGAFDHLMVDALSSALAVQIARQFRGTALRLLPAGRLSKDRLKRVLDYIDAHLASPLLLSDLAAVACLSPYHFARSFKRSIGMGPHRYVMERRIERARRLILQSELSLTDIAAAVGFDSQASFTARFSRQFGMTPGRLRREAA
jgi:AraC family transcriptional regulator